MKSLASCIKKPGMGITSADSKFLKEARQEYLDSGKDGVEAANQAVVDFIDSVSDGRLAMEKEITKLGGVAPANPFYAQTLLDQLQGVEDKFPEEVHTLPDDDPRVLAEPHKIDTPERNAMRQEVIDAHFVGHTPKKKPKAILMGGGGGSGKGTILSDLDEAGDIKRSDYVEVDPDEIKQGSKKFEGIPEYDDLASVGDHRAAGVAHKESGSLAKRVIERATSGKYNIVIDKTFSKEETVEEYAKMLRDNGYEVKLIGATVEPEVALYRASGRAERGGRFVPTTPLLEAHKGFSNVIEAFSNISDDFTLYDNNGEKYVLIAKKVGQNIEVYNEIAYNRFIAKGVINEKASKPSEIRTIENQASGSTAIGKDTTFGEDETGNLEEKAGRKGRAEENQGKSSQEENYSSYQSEISLSEETSDNSIIPEPKEVTTLPSHLSGVVKNLSKTERVAYSAVIKDLIARGLPESILEKVTEWKKMNPNGRGNGAFVTDEGIIAIKDLGLKEGSAIPKELAENLRKVIAHELGHAFDAVPKSERDTDESISLPYRSQRIEGFKAAKDAEFIKEGKEGQNELNSEDFGEYSTELIDWFYRSDLKETDIARHLWYPTNNIVKAIEVEGVYRAASKTKDSTEFFAQAFMIYNLDPNSLKKNAPKTYAFMNEVVTNENVHEKNYAESTSKVEQTLDSSENDFQHSDAEGVGDGSVDSTGDISATESTSERKATDGVESRVGVGKESVQRDAVLNKDDILVKEWAKDAKPVTTETVEKVTSAVQKTMKSMPSIGNINTVSGIADLPVYVQAQLSGIEGSAEHTSAVIDPVTGEIFVIAANVKGDPATVVPKLIHHELVGHFGIRALFDNNEKLNNFLRRFKKTYPKLVQAIATDYKIDTSAEAGQLLAAEEAFSSMAADLLLANPKIDKPGLFNSIKNLLRNLMDKLGFKYSDAEIIALVARANDSINNKASFEQAKTNMLRNVPHRILTSSDKVSITQAKLLQKMNPKNIVQPDTFLDRMRKARSQFRHWAVTATVDRYHYMKKYLDDNGLVNLSSEESPYKQMRMAAGAELVIDSAMTYGIPVFKDGYTGNEPIDYGNGKVGGLMAVFEHIDGKIEHWNAYMVARRAERLIKEGRENFMTPEDIQAGLEFGKNNKSFEEAAEMYEIFNQKLLQYMEDSNLISKETRELWANSAYVPFYRVSDEDVVSSLGGTGMVNPKAQPRLFGGKNRVNDITENIIMNLSYSIKSAMNNQARLLAVDTITQNSEGVDIENVSRGSDFKPTMEQIEKVLADSGMIEEDINNLTDEEKNSFGRMMLNDPKLPEEANLVVVYRDGQRESYRVNDELAIALTAFNMETMPWAARAVLTGLGVPKRLLTTMATSTPAFALANVMRDTIHSWGVGHDKRKILSGDVFSGAYKSLAKKESYMDLYTSGSMFEQGYINSGDPNATARTAKRMISKAKSKAISNLVMIPWHQYSQILASSENANRIAVYEAALRAGDSKAEALFKARDIMDFSKHGRNVLVRALIQVVPFLNARVQGLHRTGEYAIEKPKSFFMKIGMLAAFSIALKYYNDDDEYYQDQPEYKKDTRFYIPVYGTDIYLTPPKPFEFGTIGATLPERIYELITSDNPEKGALFAERMAWNLKENLSMNLSAQAWKPIVEVFDNFDSFRGRPIHSYWDEKNLPPEIFNDRTSETSKLIQKMFPDYIKKGATPQKGASAKQIDHLIQGYLASVGGGVLMLSDAIIRKVKDLPELPEKHWTEQPLLSRFFASKEVPSTSKYSELFWAMKDQVDTAASSGRRVQKSIEKTQGAQRKEFESRREEIREDYGTELRLKDLFKDSSKDLRENFAIISRTKSGNLKPSEKAKIIRERQKRVNDIYKRTMERVKELRAESKTISLMNSVSGLTKMQLTALSKAS